MGILTPKTATQRIFSKIPAIETPRLTLRRILPEDAEDMYEYARLAEVTRYLTWVEHDDLSYTREYLIALQRAYKRGEFFDWGLELKDSGKFIGTCGFTAINEDHNFAEVGYVLSPAYQGKGYMTEALREVLRFGFEFLCFQRIEAKHIEGNDSSAAVMTRCGMKWEGRLRNSMLIKGDYRTIHVYAILKSEYENLNGQTP